MTEAELIEKLRKDLKSVFYAFDESEGGDSEKWLMKMIESVVKQAHQAGRREACEEIEGMKNGMMFHDNHLDEVISKLGEK